MSNGYIKIDRSRTPSRRGCGWGSVITTCSKCGKIMIGHNRGICSKCARGDARRHGDPIYTAHSSAFRFATSGAAENRGQAKCLRDTYANGEAAR